MLFCFVDEEVKFSMGHVHSKDKCRAQVKTATKQMDIVLQVIFKGIFRTDRIRTYHHTVI